MKPVFERIRSRLGRVALGIASFAAVAWAFFMGLVPMVAADATTDAVNSTVTLIQTLLIALLPLVILVALFSFIMGMFTGEHGIFANLNRHEGPK